MLESYLIMDTFIKELADSGLESVIKKRGLYSCYNEEGTLCILCYKHKIRKNKFVRGLVVETAHPHKTVSKGFDTFNTRISLLKPQKKIILRDRCQPESTITLKEYLYYRVDKSRIIAGKNMLKEYDGLLLEISNFFGIQPRFIIAVLGM